MDNEPKRIDKNANAIDYKPHFEWLKYLRGVFVVIFDAVLFASFCIVGFLILRYVVLANSINGRFINGEEFEAIIGHVAWPFSIFAVAFLFRNPLLMLLHETQGLIWRSYYRYGERELDAITNRKENDKNIGDEEESEGSDDQKGKEPKSSGVNNKGDAGGPNAPINGKPNVPTGTGKTTEARENDGIIIERKVLALLRKTYRVTVLQSKGIERSRYYFDGVMEYSGTLYGIEVKHTADEARWRFVLRKVGDVYENLTVDTQARFTFLACIVASSEEVSKKRSALSRLAEEQPFPVELKFFTYENGNLEEV